MGNGTSRRFRMRRTLAAALAAAACWGIAAAAVKVRVLPPLLVDTKGAPLSRPEGVAFGAGTLAVADTGAGRIVTYAVTERGVSPRADFAVAEVPYPIRLCVTSGRDILALDGRSRRIARLGPAGELKSFLDVDGIPRALALDRSDGLYVLDVSGPRVIPFDAAGKKGEPRALPATAGFFSDLAVDARGDLYLLDSVGRQIWVLRRGEKEATPLGPGLGEEAAFPTSLALTGSGLLAVADQYGGGIVFVGPDGSFRGRQLAMGWREGFLRYPSAVASDGADGLFVADRENNRVQILSIAP